MKIVYVLMILAYGTLNKPETIAMYEFSTSAACEKAAEFYTRNPYPAVTVFAQCVADTRE